MNTIEVIIKVYADDLYFKLIKTLTCEVECEYDDDGDMSYSYGWDITIEKTIEKNCDSDEWKRAFSYSHSSASVDEFFNEDGEIINTAARGPTEPFTPFVILLGESQVQGFKSKFAGKKYFSKSTSDLDPQFTKLYEHPERTTEFILHILEERGHTVKHLDVVYDPDIKSLQFLQWNEHYKPMFYLTKRDDLFEFIKVIRQFETYKKVENDFVFLLDEVDLSSKKIIDDFIQNLEVLKENSWNTLLNLSLERIQLD